MKALELMAGMVLEDGRPWAETAVPYQWEDARSVLGALDDRAGLRQFFFTRPRGGRKTTDLAAMVLAMLATQAPARARAYVGASDEDQAQELIDAADGIIARTPALRGSFAVTGLRIRYLPTGASVVALPADASAMGKRAWALIIDELANWPETKKHLKFWNTLASGNRKLADCRTVVITNAGSPDHWSFKRREVAETSPRWLLREVPGPLPWLTEDDLASLRENATTESEYERLTLNVWTQTEDRLAKRADVEACVVKGRPRFLEREDGVRYVAGLDLGKKHDRTVLAVGHVVDLDDGRQRVVLDLMRVWTPTKTRQVQLQAVRTAVAEVCAQYRAKLHYDPAQAYLLGEDLNGWGIEAVEETFTEQSNSIRAGLMHRFLRDRLFELPEDDDLIDELATARLVEKDSGALRIDHDRGRHDDRVQALALVAQHLLRDRSKRPGKLRFRDGTRRKTDDRYPFLKPPPSVAEREAQLVARREGQPS